MFGGTRRAVEAANARKLAPPNMASATCWFRLLAEVARNYIQARGYQQRLAITRSNILVQQEILDLTSNRFQSGLNSDLDVQQATAILTSTEAQVPSLETGFRQNVYALAVLLAQPPGALVDTMSVRKAHPRHPADRAGRIAFRIAATPARHSTR